MALWGEPERVNMEKLHAHTAHGCHQNVTEHSTASGHRIIYDTHINYAQHMDCESG